jgi:dihydroflavonol-4-reductase
MRKNVVVLGSTGFLGRYLCAAFLLEGRRVFAAARNLAAAEDLVTRGCIPVPGSLGDGDARKALRSALPTGDGPFIVVSCMGSVDYRQDRIQAARANVGPVEGLCAFCADLAAEGLLERLIFVGSVASLGFSDRPPKTALTETGSLFSRGRSAYCDAKRDAEDALYEACGSLGIAPIVVLPGSLVGPRIAGRGTTTVELSARAIRGGPMLSGGASYASVFRVAEGIAAAAERGRPGERYLLGGENLPMADFAALVRERARKAGLDVSKRPCPTLPRPVARILGRLSIGMTDQQALLGSSWHFIDSGKAKRELGYVHGPDDLAEAIDLNLQARETVRHGDSRFGGKDDRKP